MVLQVLKIVCGRRLSIVDFTDVGFLPICGYKLSLQGRTAFPQLDRQIYEQKLEDHSILQVCPHKTCSESLMVKVIHKIKHLFYNVS